MIPGLETSGRVFACVLGTWLVVVLLVLLGLLAPLGAWIEGLHVLPWWLGPLLFLALLLAVRVPHPWVRWPLVLGCDCALACWTGVVLSRLLPADFPPETRPTIISTIAITMLGAILAILLEREDQAQATGGGGVA